MAKAVVDPAELRQFANDLRRFNQDLDNHMRILQTRMQTLGAELERSGANQIRPNSKKPSVRSVDFEKHPKCTPFLLRKAERIEEYLKQR